MVLLYGTVAGPVTGFVRAGDGQQTRHVADGSYQTIHWLPGPRGAVARWRCGGSRHQQQRMAKAWSDAAACRGRTATVATAAWETVKEPKGS